MNAMRTYVISTDPANKEAEVVTHPNDIDTPEKHIAEALRNCQHIIDNTFEGQRFIDDPHIHILAATAVCGDFGVAFLMETLRRVAPDVADRAAQELWSIYDDGGATHELTWTWRKALEGDDEQRAWFERWFTSWLNTPAEVTR